MYIFSPSRVWIANKAYTIILGFLNLFHDLAQDSVKKQTNFQNKVNHEKVNFFRYRQKSFEVETITLSE